MCSKLDPHWWDLCVCSVDAPPPSGEIIYLPDETNDEYYESESASDLDIALAKFDPSSESNSSSDSDTDANLGGCEPPDYDFSLYMLSFSKKTSIEKQLADIDLQLSFVPAFEYILRRDLKDEKKKLLSLLEKSTKGKEKEDSPSDALTLYNPANIYRNYLDENDSRQSYRRDKEKMPSL